MYNIIIFGTGQASEQLTQAVVSKCTIIAYADNNQSKWGTYFNGTRIINPKEINTYDYDFILIASQYEDEIYNDLMMLRINKNKIYCHYTHQSFLYCLPDVAFEQLQSRKDEKVDGFITGISYAYHGINVDYLDGLFINMSNVSQDLYYDYLVAQKMLSNYTTIKYCIIGLCYYSFHFDLSLSRLKYRTVRYIDLFGDSHHHPNIDADLKKYSINYGIAKKIFNQKIDGQLEVGWKQGSLLSQKDKMENGKNTAELDSAKKYPKTVKENMDILSKYLDMLRERNIIPILTVLPTSIYYRNYFSKDLENEFLAIISQLAASHQFQFLNHFHNENFSDEDYYDVSHLNHDGAIKFTKLINTEIQLNNRSGVLS